MAGNVAQAQWRHRVPQNLRDSAFVADLITLSLIKFIIQLFGYCL
jgi:hypothetical protein